MSFLLYVNTVFNGFVYDDHSQIERNAYVHSFEHLDKIFGSALLAQQGKQAAPNFYRPTQNLSFLICYKLFGNSPYGFHLVNILLNCLAVWCAFLFTSKLFSSEPLGLLAAAIFALHPVHTEPIAWVNGIADLYYSIFYLLAFWLYLRQESEHEGFGISNRLLMYGSFALALFSKETAMTFPVMVMIYEHFYSEDRDATNWKVKTSRYVGFWATFVLYLLARTLSVGRLSPARLHTDLSFPQVIFSAFALIGEYAKKLVWPSPLVAFYPFQKSLSVWETPVLSGICVAAVATVVFVILWRRARIYSFAFIWIFLLVAPALNARWMTATVFAERYLYLPSLGVCWLVTGAVLLCWRKPLAESFALRWAVGIVGMALVLIGGREIVKRNADWKSDKSLILATLKVRPNSPYMLSDLGQMEWAEGHHDEAERLWQQALQYRPNTVEVLANLGSARLEEERYDEAIPYLEQAIALKPQFVTPHIHLGHVYEAEQKPDMAEREYRKALEIFPMNTAALTALGKLCLKEGRLAEAEKEFLAAIRVAPELDMWTGLGEVYDREGAQDKAASAWRQALAIEPFHLHAHLSLGRIYLTRKQYDLAQKEFEQCLLLNPKDLGALDGLKMIKDTVKNPAQ